LVVEEAAHDGEEAHLKTKSADHKKQFCDSRISIRPNQPD
jgi:hypothetical protein